MLAGRTWAFPDGNGDFKNGKRAIGQGRDRQGPHCLGGEVGGPKFLVVQPLIPNTAGATSLEPAGGQRGVTFLSGTAKRIWRGGWVKKTFGTRELITHRPALPAKRGVPKIRLARL